MKSRKKIVALICTIVSLLLVSVIIVLTFTIWLPQKSMTDLMVIIQDSLQDISLNELEVDSQTNPVSLERTIQIKDSKQVVAIFNQVLELDCRSEQQKAYLTVTEEYPTLPIPSDNIYDEYYFDNGTMYVRRINDGEDLRSNFESTLQVLFDVAKENLSENSYSFSENYFQVIDGQKLISEINGEVVLNAQVNEEYIDDFLGQDDANGVEKLTIEMHLIVNGGGYEFGSLFLNYYKEGYEYNTTILRKYIQSVSSIDWL